MAKGRYRNLDATRIALLLGKEPANRLRVPLCRFEPDTQEESAMANKQIEIDEDQAALVAALQKARADEGEIEKAIGDAPEGALLVAAMRLLDGVPSDVTQRVLAAGKLAPAPAAPPAPEAVLSAEARAMISKAETIAADAVARVQSMQAERDLEQITAMCRSDFAAVPGATVAARAASLQKIKAVAPKAEYEAVLAWLRAADAAVKGAPTFQTRGIDGAGAPDSDDPDAQIKALAVARAAKDNCSYPVAMERVMKTDEARKLYANRKQVRL